MESLVVEAPAGAADGAPAPVDLPGAAPANVPGTVGDGAAYIDEEAAKTTVIEPGPDDVEAAKTSTASSR